MAYPANIAFSFGSQTSGLTSQLDQNFTNLAVGLNGIGNGSSVLSSVAITAGSYASANIGLCTIANATITQETVTNSIISTANVTTLGATTIKFGDGTTQSTAAAATSFPVVQLRRQIFNSTGNFTANVSVVHKITVTGGGAGGGASQGSDGHGGGGGAAATAIAWQSLANGTVYSVTIGVGGIRGNLSSNGGNGTFSWFNGSSNITASGGFGGPTGTTTNIPGGGNPGLTGTGDLIIPGGGGDGGAAQLVGGPAGGGHGGMGGSSMFGGGAPAISGNAAIGLDGTAPGTGGGGGNWFGAGGNGANGIVIVEWMS